MEKILRIEEDTFTFGGKHWPCTYDGWQIITDQQTIKFGIENGQSCCEQWGHFVTNDTTAEFIGATVISVAIVDDCLKKEKLRDTYEGACMFLNIETDKGVLQFTAYNSHNGYYSHSAVVVSRQLNVTQSL